MIRTRYVSRRIDLSPAEAALATDLVGEAAANGTRGPSSLAEKGLRLGRRWESTVPDHRLVRRHVGSIRVFGRRVPVEFELLKWSSDSSELGIRPRGSWWPVGTERYLDSAGSALDDLCGRLVAELENTQDGQGPQWPDPLRSSHLINCAVQVGWADPAGPVETLCLL